MRTMTLTQTAEPQDVLFRNDLSDVLRIASELYAQDQLVIERASQSLELKQAAAEAGLPPEYLERAATALDTQRAVLARRRLTKWRRVKLASALVVTVGVGAFSLLRTEPTLPATVPIAVTGRNLRGANLAGQDLRGRDLSGVSLRGAVLRNTNLRGAKLTGCDLAGADLTGADLSGTQMEGALYNRSTRFPKGFDETAYHVRYRWDG